MKLVDIEKVKKSRVIQYGRYLLAGAFGLPLSCFLAHRSIDFIELKKLFSEIIFNTETLDDFVNIVKKWYYISGIIFLVAAILSGIFFVRNKKKDEEDVFTVGETIFLFIGLILMSQSVLPLFIVTITIVIELLYVVFFSSVLLKNIIGYGTYLFVLIVEKICTSSGMILTYDEFIGQESYSFFLIMITFLILTPYLLPFLLKIIEIFFQKVTGDKSAALFFKLWVILINVNTLRYIIYISLFFTSIFTYSVNVSQSDCVVSLVKEALLEFVLLDTVIYSIISKLKEKKINYEQQNMRRYYLPFKYDLEFVLSAITMQNLKNKELSARIKFSVDINRNLKMKNKKEINEIDKLLIDISTYYYEIESLEEKIRESLSRISDLIR